MTLLVVSHTMPRRRRTARRIQAGLTLVELLVAMALALLITAVAAGSLVVARIGFNSVDASSQLRENGRFAADVLQRLLVQAGFEDVAGGKSTRLPGASADPGLAGFDNAWIDSNPGAFPGAVATGNRSAAICGAADTSCLNGSDVLVVRFWGMSTTAGVADGSMINCAGVAEPDSTAVDGRAYAIFHVTRTLDGEPSLACTYRNPTSGAWQTEPLVKGVEGFQVLYGVDSVTPNAVPPIATVQTGLPTRYLRAADLVVAGNPVATRDNWGRVRTVRIGLLLRGDTGSAADRSPSAERDWDVLDMHVVNAADVGATLHVPADGRLRYRMVMSFNVRNQQGFDPPPPP